MSSYSFAGVVEALANHHGVTPARRSRLVARLQSWQKMGFPKGVNKGKGQKVKYTDTELLQLAVMMELLKLGLTPSRAIHLTIDHWAAIHKGALSAVIGRSLPGCSDVLCTFSINALVEFEGRTDSIESSVLICHAGEQVHEHHGLQINLSRVGEIVLRTMGLIEPKP